MKTQYQPRHPHREQSDEGGKKSLEPSESPCSVNNIQKEYQPASIGYAGHFIKPGLLYRTSGGAEDFRFDVTANMSNAF